MNEEVSERNHNIQWEDCDEQLDVAALALREPILFYDEVLFFKDNDIYTLFLWMDLNTCTF